MTPEAVTAAGMAAVAFIYQLPDLARIITADRRDKRKHQAANGKEAGQ